MSHNREPPRDRRRMVDREEDSNPAGQQFQNMLQSAFAEAMSSVLSNTLSRSNVVQLGHHGSQYSESGQPSGSRTTTSSIDASP